MGSHSDGGSPLHMTSPCTKLFIEQCEAVLFSRVERTARLWAGCGEKRTGGIGLCWWAFGRLW